MRDTPVLTALLSVLLVSGLALVVFSGAGTSLSASDDTEPRAATSSPATSTQMVNLYYYRPLDDINEEGELQCSMAGLAAVTREVTGEGTELISNTLTLLLEKELSRQQRQQGLTSEFPLDDVLLVGLRVDDGIATVALDDQSSQLAVDNCRSDIIRFQIEETIRQFPSVANVRFLPRTLFVSPAQS